MQCKHIHKYLILIINNVMCTSRKNNPNIRNLQIDFFDLLICVGTIYLQFTTGVLINTNK